MRQRPIGELIEALRTCDTDAKSQNGFPPVVIRADRLAGSTLSLRGNVSSQYLSALLLAAPAATGTMEFNVHGSLVSTPYIEMTLAVMHAFGVEVKRLDPMRFQVSPQSYVNRAFAIEPDASAASYFWAAAAVTGGRVRVEGLNSQSLQGDVAFCDCLKSMGCDVKEEATGTTVTGGKLSGIDVDMGAISDTVQTLAAVALFAEGPTTIRGVEHIRHKESDRIGDLARELRKLGAEVEEKPDGLCIKPGPLQPAAVETHNDHRMAMSLAVAGLRLPGIQIIDPGCTAKTYPGFFTDLEKLAAAAR
jgi:3-phosphoshikimate 1-carboxyvinyltransferase